MRENEKFELFKEYANGASTLQLAVKYKCDVKEAMDIINEVGKVPYESLFLDMDEEAWRKAYLIEKTIAPCKYKCSPYNHIMRFIRNYIYETHTIKKFEEVGLPLIRFYGDEADDHNYFHTGFYGKNTPDFVTEDGTTFEFKAPAEFDWNFVTDLKRGYQAAHYADYVAAYCRKTNVMRILDGKTFEIISVYKDWFNVNAINDRTRTLTRFAELN